MTSPAGPSIAASPPTEGITGWVVDLMDAVGAAGAGIAVAAENLFPPIPSEAILPLAGFAASRGDVSLVAALIWTTVGSVVGALALYGLGRRLGPDRLRGIVRRMPLVDLRDLDRAEAWFARHGEKAVFLGRMIPLVRSAVSVPAGVQRMPVARFVVLTAAGSAIWNAVFVLTGYGLGAQWERVAPYTDVVEKTVLGLLVVPVVVFVTRQVRRRRAPREERRARDSNPREVSP